MGHTLYRFSQNRGPAISQFPRLRPYGLSIYVGRGESRRSEYPLWIIPGVSNPGCQGQEIVLPFQVGEFLVTQTVTSDWIPPAPSHLASLPEHRSR